MAKALRLSQEKFLPKDIEDHRKYLADANRLSAFSQAINEGVKPGDVVLDLGTGTGIMGGSHAGAGRGGSI